MWNCSNDVYNIENHDKLNISKIIVSIVEGAYFRSMRRGANGVARKLKELRTA